MLNCAVFLMTFQSAEYDERVANNSLFIYILSPGLHPNSHQSPSCLYINMGKLPNAKPPWCHGSTTRKFLIHANLANSILTSILPNGKFPFRNCFPGTELLQSSFRAEFSMGSLLRRYRRSLRRHPVCRVC